MKIMFYIFTGFCMIKCGGGSLSGKYCDSDGSMCFDFTGGKACASVFKTETGCFDYDKSGSDLFIKDPSKGAVKFKVVDANTLTSEAFFFKGTYKKR